MHKMTIMKSMIFLSRSVNVLQIQVRCKHSKVMRKPLQKFKPISKWESQQNIEYEEEFIEPKVIPAKKDEIKADFLPKGMKMSDLPNFDRILGWDVKNPTLRLLRKEIGACKDPKESNKILVEGKRLIIDAINAGFYPKTFLFSRLSLLENLPLDPNRELKMVQIPYNNIQSWSSLSTSPGIMAIFDLDAIQSAVEACSTALPITVIMDNIRTPDNVGALARVAASVGCKEIITASGCADIWSAKSLRAGAGAHFTVPIKQSVPWSQIPSLVPKSSQVWLADLNDIQVNQVTNNGVIGQKLLDLHHKCQRFQVDNEDMSYYEHDILEEFNSIPLERISALALDNIGTDLVVVFGGETPGVSGMSVKLAHERSGARIFVPLKNRMDSLNVACAASVILFQLQAKMTSCMQT